MFPSFSHPKAIRLDLGTLFQRKACVRSMMHAHGKQHRRYEMLAGSRSWSGARALETSNILDAPSRATFTPQRALFREHQRCPVVPERACWGMLRGCLGACVHVDGHPYPKRRARQGRDGARISSRRHAFRANAWVRTEG